MFSEKITFLNQITLESFNLEKPEDVVKTFTEAGIKILNADFGFVWLGLEDLGDLKLVYKSPKTPYEPKQPRAAGRNQEVLKTAVPYFVEKVEKREDEYDVSQFMESFVIIPIFFRGRAFGNIVICFEKKHIFSEDDKILCGFIGNSIAQSITIHNLLSREQQARIIAESQEARFRALIENSYDAIALLDETGKITDISRSVTRIAGYDVKEFLGKNLAEFVYQEDLSGFLEHLQKTLEQTNENKTIEFRYNHKDGSLRWMEAICVNMLNNPIVGSVVVNVRDATERKKNQEMIEHQALHDTLTGLPNRQEFAAKFEQSLALAKRQSSQMALMFLDMDRFKNINDRLGHAVGDTLLKVVSSRFASSLRGEDTVARFGGDEFLILVNELNAVNDAAVVAEKILKAMEVPVKIAEYTLYPSVSIGIAVYPNDGQELAALKRNADVALYKAKEKGRNRYSFYDHSMDGMQTTEKLILENELREAIEYNQIEIYYQAIVSLKNKGMVSFEALARWNHPSKGIVMPGDFIPLAEESGLISALGKHITTLACKDYKKIQKEIGSGFRVAINVSAVRFSEAYFVEEIENILKESEMSPEDLELEITETAAMHDLELTDTNLRKLRKMGVSISIDDFGTGYSSLSYLKRFPISNLKIDKSFIRGSITNPQDTSITKTIIAMAENLSVKVIAEGVETQQQKDLLQSWGCDFVQGFYIHTPMPANEFIKWFKGSEYV